MMHINPTSQSLWLIFISQRLSLTQSINFNNENISLFFFFQNETLFFKGRKIPIGSECIRIIIEKSKDLNSVIQNIFGQLNHEFFHLHNIPYMNAVISLTITNIQLLRVKKLRDAFFSDDITRVTKARKTQSLWAHVYLYLSISIVFRNASKFNRSSQVYGMHYVLNHKMNESKWKHNNKMSPKIKFQCHWHTIKP